MKTIILKNGERIEIEYRFLDILLNELNKSSPSRLQAIFHKDGTAEELVLLIDKDDISAIV